MSDEQQQQDQQQSRPAPGADNPYARAAASMTQASAPPGAQWSSPPASSAPPVAPPGMSYAAGPSAPPAPTPTPPPAELPQDSVAAAFGISPSTAARENEHYDVKDPSEAIHKAKVIGAIAAAVLLVVLLVYELVPASVPAPTVYSKFKALDGRFSCDVPEGWSVVSSGADSSGHNPVGLAVFREGPAKIGIITDTVVDLKANALLNSGAALPDDFTKDPTDVLHKQARSRTEMSLKNYSEEPSTEVDTNLGLALVSEFKGVGGFMGLGGPMHGYRASMSDSDNTFEVVLQCPEKSWATLQPAFMHVIKSMAPVDGGVFSPTFPGVGTGSDQSAPSTPAAGGGSSGLPTVGYGGAPASNPDNSVGTSGGAGDDDGN